jgi:broad specificity phosphatase PhoE
VGLFLSTQFILVRHGETEWNRVERFRGRADIPLNDTGRAQAQKLAARLAGEKIRAVYSSPLQRAVQTATPVAEALRLKVKPHANLLDVDYGAWEGLSPEEAQAKFPEDYDRWLTTPRRVKFPGGESLRLVRVNIGNLLSELAEKHSGETVALVTHKVPCLVTMCYVLGLTNDSIWKLRIDLAAINRFERREDKFVVTQLNSREHLGA